LNTDNNKVQRMRTTYWLTKATHTHTHTEYIIFITFPMQQCLRERASILCLCYFVIIIILLFLHYYRRAS